MDKPFSRLLPPVASFETGLKVGDEIHAEVAVDLLKVGMEGLANAAERDRLLAHVMLEEAVVDTPEHFLLLDCGHDVQGKLDELNVDRKPVHKLKEVAEKPWKKMSK